MKKAVASPIEKPHRNVRKRGITIAALLASIALPTLAIMTLSIFMLRDALLAREAARRQTTIERDKLFAHSVAHGIAIYIESAKDAVVVAAKEAEERPLTGEGMRPLLTNMVDNTSAFFAATVATTEGVGFIAYDPTGRTEEERYPSGLDVSGRDYFRQLLETKQPVISDAITSILSPQSTIAIAAPILDEDGEVRGLVAVGVSLAPLYDLALVSLGDEDASPVVFDKRGQALVHPNPELVDLHALLGEYEPAKRALRGEEGFLDSFIDTDGRVRSAAYEAVPGLGWGVWISQDPPADAVAFVRNELLRASTFYGVVLLLNLILALVIWRLLRRLFIMNEKERAFMESIGDGVIAVDRSWKIILWNRAASQMTGWAAKETMGKPFRDHVRFIRERDRKENLAFIEEAMLFGETRPMSNSTVLLTRDGREIPISDSASPLFDEKGEVDGVIIIFRDATREKDAAMLRTDFAYASHQLRTPANKAMWDIELAMDEAKDPSLREKLRVAYDAIRDVQKLSSRLIDVSQIDQRQVVPAYEEIKLAALLKESADAVKDEAKERRVQVLVKTVRDDKTIDTDPRMLRTALQEVIDNSVRYSPAGGIVEVVAQAEKSDFIIQVMDRGIGISEEQKPLVFTKFFRGQNVPQDAHGAGLGLFIAREYVKLLNGKIWFDSRLGFGTTFTISIPRVRGSKD